MAADPQVGFFIFCLGDVTLAEQRSLPGQFLAHVVTLHLEFTHSIVTQVIRQDALVPLFGDDQVFDQVIDLFFENCSAQVGLVAFRQLAALDSLGPA